MDDFLIHGNTNNIDQKVRLILDRSHEIGLKFNPDKIKLRVPEVSYVGHLLTAQGLKPMVYGSLHGLLSHLAPFRAILP